MNDKLLHQIRNPQNLRVYKSFQEDRGSFSSRADPVSAGKLNGGFTCSRRRCPSADLRYQPLLQGRFGLVQARVEVLVRSGYPESFAADREY